MTSQPYAQQATANSAGVASLTFTTRISTVAWRIGQLSVETNPTGPACTATMRLDGLLITATVTGSGDTAVGPPDILLEPGSQLTVTWANAPAGSACTATILYDEIPR